MSEQFVRAWSVDPEKLRAVVGSADGKLRKRVLAREGADEVAELIEEEQTGDIEQVLDEILSRRLVDAHAYAYRRILELLASVVGRALRPADVTLPGRGWQSLGPAWSRLGQKGLASFWGGGWNRKPELPWPFARASKKREVDWPIALLIAPARLDPLADELAAFDASAIDGATMKGTCFDQPGDHEWIGDELAHLVAGLRRWVKAVRPGESLLLVHDGQQ